MIATAILIIWLIGYVIYQNITLKKTVKKLTKENEKINELEIENQLLKKELAKPQQIQTNVYIYQDKDSQS